MRSGGLRSGLATRTGWVCIGGVAVGHHDAVYGGKEGVLHAHVDKILALRVVYTHICCMLHTFVIHINNCMLYAYMCVCVCVYEKQHIYTCTQYMCVFIFCSVIDKHINLHITSM